MLLFLSLCSERNFKDILQDVYENIMSRGRIVELTSPSKRRVFNKLMEMYHVLGRPRGPSPSRYFVYVIDEGDIEYWVAGIVLQEATVFSNALRSLNLPVENTLFIRRIASFCPKICCDFLADFLVELSAIIKREGEKKAIVTFGLDKYIGEVYKKAGFNYVGVTKSGKDVYIKYIGS